MQNIISKNRYIVIDSGDDSGHSMSFELQPIAHTGTTSAFGFEMLFRGQRDRSWLDVDRTVLQYFQRRQRSLPRLFVNLANESLLTIPHCEFIGAARSHDIIFELSEMHSEAAAFEQIVAKVNNLIALGVRFAVDDFGSGRDGLQRLYALESVAAVKVDGALLRRCMARPDAARMLKLMLDQWRLGGIEVVAECVENAAIYRFASDLGFDLLQGWHIDSIFNDAAQAA